jgi:hypothetical protein
MQDYALPFRFITKSIHAYLIDYPAAIVLMVAPFLLKLGQSSPVALWLFGGDPRRGAAAAGSHGPPDGARPGRPLLAASLGGPRIGCGLHHCPLRFPFHCA